LAQQKITKKNKTNMERRCIVFNLKPLWRTRDLVGFDFLHLYHDDDDDDDG
jgi:hypothetical protein